MNMNEIMELPLVKAAIQHKAEQEEQAAIEVRRAIIMQMEEAERGLAPLENKLAECRERAEKARLAYQKLLSEVFAADAELSAQRGIYSNLHRKLRKEHGERYVMDAIARLEAIHGHLLKERERLDGLASRVVESVPGYFVRLDNPKAVADLAELRQKIDVVAEALDQANKLKLAELSPGELQKQSEAILLAGQTH